MNLGRFLPAVVRPAARRTAAAVAVLALSLSLAGCGGDDEPEATPTTPLPTPNVTVPDGVELTESGAELAFGQSAVVAYEANPERGTVLELTVDSVRKGAIADLSGYVLDKATKASTPYYVRVSVKNVGAGDVGKTPIPLWAVDGTNTLVQASSFTNVFRRCPSRALPASFAPSAELSTCLMYLLPEGGELTAVSFRPLQAFAPIEWAGTVETPAPGTKKAS